MTEEEKKHASESEEKGKETSSQEKELFELKQSLNECQDKYLRVLAESENARKRMQKEKTEQTLYAKENLLVEFLHPLDSFEKALKFAESMSQEVKNWAIGFEMILSQFKQVLTNNGVHEYHSIGKMFDPHLHEAAEIIETTDYAPGVVVEEDLRGYKMGERTIRVARVKVAKAPEKQERNDEQKKEG